MHVKSLGELLGSSFSDIDFVVLKQAQVRDTNP
jgi:hypothetical protein